MKKRISSAILAITLMAGLSTTAFAAGQSFADVPSGRWYCTWVTKAAQQGWVSGIGGGKFNPEGTVTYAQFSLMLSKALYKSDINAQPAGAQWWIAGCEVADRHGLFKGTDMVRRSNWDAVANTPIEREQMAQMMYNALVDSKVKLPSYDEYSEAALGINDIMDVDNYDAVASCYAVGLLSGNGNGFFAPRDNMTRAQATVVLCRMYDAVLGADPEQPGEPDIPGTDTVTVTPFHNSRSASNGNAYITFGLHVLAEKNSIQEFFFTIDTKGGCPSGVIMPDDTTVMIEGTGDASFDEIRFTEPGTYSFVISEEEGMDNYRYDTRTWEITVTVSGTVGAPIGAVGGHYDISVYDVPADANKDGWITESEVQAVLDQLRIDYPTGSH